MPDRPPHNPGEQSLVVTGPAPGAGSAGGARTLVATDDLLAQVDRLGTISETLRLSGGALIGVLDHGDAVSSIGMEIPVAALDANRVIGAAIQTLWTAQRRAADLRGAILQSVERYASVEDASVALAHRAQEQAAWGLGFFVRTFAIPLGVVAVEGLLVTSLALRIPPSQLAAEAQSGLKANGRILTNPVTVAAIREAAADADGFDAGFETLPLPLADALESSGISGVRSASATVLTIGTPVGLFHDTPVSVRRTSAFEFGSPAKSLADRANSFPNPEADPNGEQIRIDRYITPGKPDRFDVFIAGTVTFDPKTAGQPFDLTSDLSGVAGESPASYRAVEAAMAQAGVTPESPVVLNGYSQGGLLASLVAASGKYNVKGVVTFGAPSAQVRIPASVPVLSIRNTEDLVPATSGYDVNPNAVVVERSAFGDGPIPSDWAVPAHRLSYYQQTAAVVDKSGSNEVRSVLDPIDAFGHDTQRVDSTLWVATRD